MADLIDRLSGTATGGRPKLHSHQFVAGLRLYALGKWTAAEAKEAFDLQGAELTQANLVISELDSRVGTTAKILYVLQVGAVANMLEEGNDTTFHNPDGTIDKTRVQADLDI